MRIFAIGDVHGRLDLLSAMLSRIDDDLAKSPVRDWRIVLLGDHVDRGPDSKGVLDLLCARRLDGHTVLLAGNHDVEFLEFLAKPASESLFAAYGGRETTLSYGVEPDFSSDAAAVDTRDRLVAAIPAEHLRLLAQLGRSASYGDFFFCHAGIRPGVPLESQDPQDLMWIRRDFLTYTGLYPKVVVHGHTPSSEPELLPNRVNVDTRAYASGRLTALVIDGARKELISVEDSVSAR